MDAITNENKSCNLMGAGVEDVVDERVMKALERSSCYSKLSIDEFIRVTGFKVDELMFNYFWQIIAKRRNIYINSTVLKFIGYEGEEKFQRRNFIAFLKRQEAKFEELASDDV